MCNLKKSITLFFCSAALCLIFAACQQSNSTSNLTAAPAIIDSTDVKQLLLAWLNGRPVNDSGWIEWQPTAAEKIEIDSLTSFGNLIVTDSGYSRTAIDSAFKFTQNGKNYLVQLLNTYGGITNDTMVMDCHPCAPLLGAAIFEIHTGNKLVPVRIKKFISANGSFGIGGEVELISYATNRMALMATAVYNGQGYVTVKAELYDINTFKKIFEFERHNDNTDAVIFENQVYANECEPHFEETGGRIQLTLTCDGTTMRTKTQKVVPFHAVKQFVFDEEQQVFVPAYSN